MASEGEQIEVQYDYEQYLRFRSLNAVLCALIPWTGIWFLVGITVAAVGYAARPEAPVVGLDPVGRAYDLQILTDKPATKGM